MSAARNTETKETKEVKEHKEFELDGLIVDGFIGKGTFASVFKARTKNGKLCALKVYLCNEKLRNIEIISKEISAYTQIQQRLSSHPGLVKLLHTLPAPSSETIDRLLEQKAFSKQESLLTELPKTETAPILVMEYCSLGTLEQFLKENKEPLSAYELLCVFSQLLNALNALHSVHFAHNDLLAKNIFLTKENGEVRLKIGDFGIARHFRPSELTYWVEMIDKLFTAPELKERDGFNVDKTDIYLLGMTLAQLLLPEMDQLIKDYRTELRNLEKSRSDKTWHSDEIKIQQCRNKFKDHVVSNLNKFSESKKEYKPLTEILIGMLAPDPTKRLSAEKAAEQISELLKNNKLNTTPTVKERVFSITEYKKYFTPATLQETDIADIKNVKATTTLSENKMISSHIQNSYMVFENEKTLTHVKYIGVYDENELCEDFFWDNGIILYNKLKATPSLAVEIRYFRDKNDISPQFIYNELAIQTQIPTHPNLVPFLHTLYTFGRDNDFLEGLAFVFENCEDSLAHFVTPLEKLTPYEELISAYQITDGLNALHADHFSYKGNLNSKAIYLGRDEKKQVLFKLGDFHLVKKSDKKEDFQQDINALAIVFLNLLKSKRLEDVSQAHLLLPLLTKMFDANPAKRPTSAEVKQEINAILAQEMKLSKVPSNLRFSFANTLKTSTQQEEKGENGLKLTRAGA